MKNDTAVSLLVASLVIALVCVPVMAVTVSFENKTYGIHIEKEAQVINGSYYVDISDIPSVHPGVTYPQEYYDLGTVSYGVALPTWGYDNYVEINDPKYVGRSAGATRIGTAQWMELRRQTILMEKQNELLAEQNELMGRLVNATEIKIECKATEYYVKEPIYYIRGEDIRIDPDAFNSTEYNYIPTEADKISCDSMSHFQGCS